MKNEEFGNEHVPRQELGEKMDAVEKRSFDSETAAIEFFQLAKHRLLDVNRWTNLAGSSLSEFQLTDSLGNVVDRNAQENDFIRIDIPGPGSASGNGYDWVKIEAIVEENEVGKEAISLRARPSSNPNTSNADTAHFLTEQATTTFQVKCIGTEVYAEEHGRNEQANTYTLDTTDNIRNMLVGWAAMLGFSYPQWKSLIKGLLADLS